MSLDEPRMTTRVLVRITWQTAIDGDGGKPLQPSACTVGAGPKRSGQPDDFEDSQPRQGPPDAYSEGPSPCLGGG